MKKFLCVFFCLLMSFSIAAADRSAQLKVLNWADYISPEVLEAFPQWYYEHTGETVDIVYSTFDINETALTKIEMGKEDYDVFCPSEYIIERMIKNGLVLPLDKDIIPDSINYFNNVSKFAVEKFNQMSDKVNVEDYATGYMWGTTGWLYNEELVDEADLHTWNALKNEKYKNKILVKDAYRDVYFVLVQYCYYDDILSGKATRQELTTNITQERLDSVCNYLISCKGNIEGYEVDFGKEDMVKGVGWLNLSWSGDANWAIIEAEKANVKLNYIVPDEGSNVWFDGWVIPKYAKNKKAATYFIDYLCREDNVLKNMDEIGYVSCVATPDIIAQYEDDQTFSPVNLTYLLGEGYDKVCVNPVLYPDKNVIDRCELMHDAGDMTSAITEMWNKVKTTGTSKWVIVFGVVLVLAVVVFGVYEIKVFIDQKKSSKKSRKRKR